MKQEKQSEFDLITQYFSPIARKRDDVILGIGDDCALLRVSSDQVLASSIDTIVEGIHFFADTPPYFLGYKSLAISLSDIAAMGATPTWVTLAMTLSQAHPAWLEEFCCGFEILLQRYNLQLIGGNLSRGQLSITTQLHGLLPSGKALRRSGAHAGDLIYVTGNLGDAGLALQLVRQLIQQQKNDQNCCIEEEYQDFIFHRLYCPMPRIREGQVLLDVASAAIDISDGLMVDVGHILESSNVGATIDVAKLPLSAWLQDNTVSLEQAWQLALSAGDDYELCFTIPASKRSVVEKIARNHQHQCKFTLIGVIDERPGLRVINTIKNNNDAVGFICVSDGYFHSW